MSSMIKEIVKTSRDKYGNMQEKNMVFLHKRRKLNNNHNNITDDNNLNHRAPSMFYIT